MKDTEHIESDIKIAPHQSKTSFYYSFTFYPKMKEKQLIQSMLFVEK